MGNDTGDPSVGQAVPIDPTTATIVADQHIQILAGTSALNAVVCRSMTHCVAAGSRFDSTGAVTKSLTPQLVGGREAITSMAPGLASTVARSA